MSKLKIGITSRKEASIWSNGLDQNIYFIYKMFEEMDYSPELISEDLEAKKLIDIEISNVNISNIKKFDIIIEVANPLSDKLTKYYNSLGKPLISLKLGNNFMMDLEAYISTNKDIQNRSCGVNIPFRNREIWVSEQFYKFKDYIETITRANVKIFPFVWESSILMAFDENFHQEDMYVKQDDFKKIIIAEPNINILKNCMIPLSICNLAYLKDKDSVNTVYCLGSKHLDKNKTFLNFIQRLKIHNDKISSYENRFPLYKMFKNKYVNTVVSCQWFNEQNYLYAETLFYKRLLIHNSPIFKDVGIYYNELDVNDGAQKLIDSVYNFDQRKNAESYEEKLFELSIYNPKNQEKARELIESVI